MNSAVIVAAGSGNRLGQRTPKQFIPIHGQEILSYSVNTFFKHPKIEVIWDHIVEEFIGSDEPLSLKEIKLKN